MLRLIDHPHVRLAALLLGLLIAFSCSLHGLMTQGAALTVASSLIAFGVMPHIIELAHKVGALDITDTPRRILPQITPRIGGVAVHRALLRLRHG